MARLHRILLVSSVLAFLLGFGWNVGISEAHPSGHSHEHIFSSHDKQHESSESKAEKKFYCPMHKPYSLTPCPHAHTQKEMAQPEQCKASSECGRSFQKPLPDNLNTSRTPKAGFLSHPPQSL